MVDVIAITYVFLLFASVECLCYSALMLDTSSLKDFSAEEMISCEHGNRMLMVPRVETTDPALLLLCFCSVVLCILQEQKEKRGEKCRLTFVSQLRRRLSLHILNSS